MKQSQKQKDRDKSRETYVDTTHMTSTAHTKQNANTYMIGTSRTTYNGKPHKKRRKTKTHNQKGTRYLEHKDYLMRRLRSKRY